MYHANLCVPANPNFNPLFANLQSSEKQKLAHFMKLEIIETVPANPNFNLHFANCRAVNAANHTPTINYRILESTSLLVIDNFIWVWCVSSICHLRFEKMAFYQMTFVMWAHFPALALLQHQLEIWMQTNEIWMGAFLS